MAWEHDDPWERVLVEVHSCVRRVREARISSENACFSEDTYFGETRISRWVCCVVSLISGGLRVPVGPFPGVRVPVGCVFQGPRDFPVKGH